MSNRESQAQGSRARGAVNREEAPRAETAGLAPKIAEAVNAEKRWSYIE